MFNDLSKRHDIKYTNDWHMDFLVDGYRYVKLASIIIIICSFVFGITNFCFHFSIQQLLKSRGKEIFPGCLH
ncbi:MAG: hypothetical protein ACM67Z_10120, partial [Clostridiales bacterium]